MQQKNIKNDIGSLKNHISQIASDGKPTQIHQLGKHEAKQQQYK